MSYRPQKLQTHDTSNQQAIKRVVSIMAEQAISEKLPNLSLVDLRRCQDNVQAISESWFLNYFADLRDSCQSGR